MVTMSALRWSSPSLFQANTDKGSGLDLACGPFLLENKLDAELKLAAVL